MQWRRTLDQLLTILYVVFLADLLNSSVHARQIRRICKNELDIQADSGVRIEPVERSHAELSLPDHTTKNRFVIKFEFKTTHPDGILFYGRTRGNLRELIALRLVRGALYYKIQCPTVSADVLIPLRHMSPLNDGNWHSVALKFRKGGMKAHVEVDGVRDTKTYEVSCAQMMSLVFGGISHHDREALDWTLGYVDHFDGCIRNVQVPTALRTPPKYYAVSVCD